MRNDSRLRCLIVLATLAGSSWGWGQDKDSLEAPEDMDARVERIVRERKAREEALAREPTSLDDGASVNPELLKVITDDSFGIRYEERDIYFRMLELALKTPLSQQEKFMAQFRGERRIANYDLAQQYLGVGIETLPKGLERSRLILARNTQLKPDTFPAFQDIFLYPEQNRGRPVSLRGVMRKLTKFDPGKNNRGIDVAYEGWVYTEDSGTIPAVVVFVNKPDQLAVGGDIQEEVRLTGYFFKMYTYEGQERATRAPLILAGEVEWRPRPKPWEPQSLPIETYLSITLVVLLVGYVAWQTNRREMTSQIHPRIEADFSKFPPVEHPKSEHTGDAESKPAEPNDS